MFFNYWLMVNISLNKGNKGKQIKFLKADYSNVFYTLYPTKYHFIKIYNYNITILFLDCSL